MRCEDRIGDACEARYELKRSLARKPLSDMIKLQISAVLCSSTPANVTLAVLHVPVENAGLSCHCS